MAVLVALIGGCAHAKDVAFLNAKSAADQAEAEGRPRDAAIAYERAAASAKEGRNRGEARYLAAASYARLGDLERARELYQQLLREEPGHARAPRSAFALAQLQLQSGDQRAALVALDHVIVSYPNAGLARRALALRLQATREQGDAVSSFLNGLLPIVASTELDEDVRYAVARELETSGRLSEARAAYLDCAARHPYPHGSLFDDALYHASQLAEQLGDYPAAIADLERLLREREPSALVGSYERPRYAPSALRIAELYRDRLHDHPAARRAFHRLYSDHDTSILRDDALWQEALLAREDGDERGTCTLTALIKREFPSSRYAPCADVVCAPHAAPGQGCHAYVLRSAVRPSAHE